MSCSLELSADEAGLVLASINNLIGSGIRNDGGDNISGAVVAVQAAAKVREYLLSLQSQPQSQSQPQADESKGAPSSAKGKK